MYNEQSIWEQEMKAEIRDVVIAGGGLVGLWCAYELKKNHPLLGITLIEKDIVPSGASTRNAGFTCFGSPTEMLHDIALMGADKMWEVVEMRFKGIQKIKSLFSQNIDYDNCGGYECFRKKDKSFDELNHEVEKLNKGLKQVTGDDKTFKWSCSKLEQFGLTGFDYLTENKLEGSLNSGKLVNELANIIQRMGVKIIRGVELLSWQNKGGELLLQTNQFSISCRRLILCTNSISPNNLSANNTTATRGQVLVTSPIEGLQLNGTFHFDEGYYYFRNVGNRVLLGGARNAAFDEEQTSINGINQTVQTKLEEFLQSHIISNKTYTVTHRWSGIMAFTQNKQPCISEVEENVLSVIACNGMGVALSPIIAEKVVGQITG